MRCIRKYVDYRQRCEGALPQEIAAVFDETGIRRADAHFERGADRAARIAKSVEGRSVVTKSVSKRC